MTDTAVFRLLVIADTHYELPGRSRPDTPPQRLTRLGCELARRAVEDARRRGGFDAVAMMGDLLNDGTAAGADQAAAEVLDAVAEAAGDKPLLVIPGNHDYDGDRLPEPLAGRDGVCEIGGYRFVTIADPYVDTMYCTRRQEDRDRLMDLAGRDGGPIVVLQHNPVSPYIDSSGYPFMLTNRDEVVTDYEAAGVLLSISGHYHAGQPLTREGGVHYFTAPTICESPFRYCVVTLSGRDVSVETRELRLPDTPPLWDTHAHTEFAYCAKDVSAAKQLDRAEVFGVAGVCLVEHGPQLYVSAEDFWAARHVRQPQCWRSGGSDRMSEFRAAIEPLRGPRVRIGLEVEADADGQLILREEDRHWPDVLVGAVHWLPRDTKEYSDAEFAAAFMRSVEAMLTGGVDILAHPLRIFGRDRKPSPQLQRDLAAMLAGTNTAAEINFHINRPTVEFFAECIRQGVKITFGSDAHWIYESAAFNPHLDLLRKAAGREDVTDLLYRP